MMQAQRNKVSNAVPELTRKEWETVRHLLLHCGNWNHCGLTAKQIDVLYKKLKMRELAEEHAQRNIQGSKRKSVKKRKKKMVRKKSNPKRCPMAGTCDVIPGCTIGSLGPRCPANRNYDCNGDE